MAHGESALLPASELGPEGSGQVEAITREWCANWRTGIACFVGMGLGASITPSLFSLFIIPLENAFGWSRGEIALAGASSIASGIAAPFAGRLIDRVGTRIPLLSSIVVLAIAWALLASMTGSILQYYVFYTAMAVGGLLTTGLSYSRVICSTFVQSRGLSLAVGRSGMAISGALLPLALFAINEHYGWRFAYLFLSAIVLCISLPVAWLWIERTPKDRSPSPRAPVSTRWVYVIASKRVLTISGAAALAYAPLIAIMSQAQPLLIGKGLPGETASALVGMLGIASLIGAIVTGLLLDRLWAPGVAFVMLMAGAGGALLLGYGPSEPAYVILATLLVGLTMGAEMDLVAFVIARYCGVESYGSVFGISVMAIAFASAGGSAAIGFIYDATGSYAPAMAIASVSFACAALLYLSLGRYPSPEDT